MSKHLNKLLGEAVLPAARPTAAGGWTGPPVPLTGLIPVPPFPLHTLPAKVSALVLAGAAALNVPPDYLAVVALAVLRAASGRTRAARLKASWREFPALWVAVVAPPGSNKSAALALMLKPLRAAEARLLAAFEAEIDEYQAELDRHTAAVKEWKAGRCEGDRPKLPARPPLRQLLADKFTGEGLLRVLRDNPHGLLVAKDELAGVVAALDMYRGLGDDRQPLLGVWAGAPVKVNRAADKDAPPPWVPAPFLAHDDPHGNARM